MLEIGTTIVRFTMDKSNVLEVGNENVVLFFGKKKVFVNSKKIAIIPHPTERYKCICHIAKWLYQKSEIPLYYRGVAEYALLRQSVTEEQIESLTFNV